jgi:hypothetical protein
VTSPVVVKGTASVFEGTVNIRVFDEAGEVVGESFATATCGNGCRGKYSDAVDFFVDREQPGVVQVFWTSPENGDEMDVVEIPVTLLPREVSQEAPIVVQDPRPGGPFAPGSVVSGTANVFEATVSIRVRDENGQIIVDTFTTATCGTGCRGTFSQRIDFAIDEEQTGMVEVFSRSAENGKPMDMVKIPVTLLPFGD